MPETPHPDLSRVGRARQLAEQATQTLADLATIYGHEAGEYPSGDELAVLVGRCRIATAQIGRHHLALGGGQAPDT